MADLVGAQCGAVIGLHPQDDEWLSGKAMAGVWFKTLEDSAAHQRAMDCVPHGRYRAMAVAPLTSKPPRSPRHLSDLRHARPDDPLHQRSAVDWLPEARLYLGRRVGVRRLVGKGAQDGRAGAHHSLLCGTALRRGGRRRATDGHSAALSSGGDRGARSAQPQRASLPDPAVRDPERCGGGLAVSYSGEK